MDSSAWKAIWHGESFEVHRDSSTKSFDDKCGGCTQITGEVGGEELDRCSWDCRIVYPKFMIKSRNCSLTQWRYSWASSLCHSGLRCEGCLFSRPLSGTGELKFKFVPTRPTRNQWKSWKCGYANILVPHHFKRFKSQGFPYETMQSLRVEFDGHFVTHTSSFLQNWRLIALKPTQYWWPSTIINDVPTNWCSKSIWQQCI